MRAPDLDRILSAMLHTYDGVSDLNFSVGRPLQVEDFGELKPVFVEPPIDALTPFQTEQIALALMQGNRRLMRDFLLCGSCDCSYALADEARFRVNIFRQQGQFAIVMRKLQAIVPSLESLELPSVFGEIAKEKNGLVLVTGATGSGKTTTLAAILNEINETQSVHIVTLEDPIEFVHPLGRATFNQRELGHDFDNYPNGLRAALRQAPKVIFVGEMRDRATVEVALMAAETGHLVLSTLHTVDAGQAINRILGLFSLGEEQQLRLRLADSVRYIVSQRLAPKDGGGRQLLTEIMGNNLRTRESIALGEGEHRSFYEIIEASASFGWTTFDQSILSAYEAGAITEETANRFASKKGRVTRGIDLLQKMRGIDDDRDTGLRLDRSSAELLRKKGMNLESEHHVFDLGDQTALVCLAASPYQKSIAAQLVALDYKVHLGLFEEDVLLKLATCSYNVVIIDENFKEAGADENVILREIVKRSGSLRREHFVVLLSQRFATNDATSAFVMSVDQIINFGDLANFKPILRRGVAMHQDLYRPFLETIKVVQAL